MRILLLGGSGMLGTDIRTALAQHDVAAPTRHDLDLADQKALDDAARGVDVVINSAAFTDVDRAESIEDAAYEVNALGAQRAAAAAAAAAARFVHVSTDYVFDGTASSPYREDSALAPVNAYGRSKAAGESAVAAVHPSPLIVRTAWLYGAHGSNFARTMLDLARRRETVSVVTDQLGQPTWTHDLASSIVALIESGAPGGIFHGTNSGQATWFEFAREIFALSGLDPERVLPTTSASFPRPAARPRYSVLGHEAWAGVGLATLRPWREAIAEAVRSGALEER